MYEIRTAGFIGLQWSRQNVSLLHIEFNSLMLSKKKKFNSLIYMNIKVSKKTSPMLCHFVTDFQDLVQMI